VRECESYWSDSPGVDGGAFDIDWGNEHNVVERSYGHDTIAYCVAVFGAKNSATTNSLIRANVCAGLGRSPRLARHHGAIHLSTWDGGSLDGVRIEDNLIEWDSPIRATAIKDDAKWTGAAGLVVRGNTIREGTGASPGLRGGTIRFQLDESADSRGLRVVMESAKAQYSSKGLRIIEQRGSPRVEYMSADGKLIRSWEGYAPASEIIWLVRQSFKSPAEW
jgi:hypothetical protein